MGSEFERPQVHANSGDLLAGRFEVRAELGAGSFGRVLRCFDRETQREVALKELHRFGADALVRFKKEFRALNDVQHPNLVRLYELFENENRQWAFTMELVPGTDFLSWVRRADVARGYDEERLRGALGELTQGLCALHGLGILHRDVKPENIRVTPEARVVLLDFGLITHLEASKQTTEAAGVGTAAYMAPEQASRRVGPAADFYAVGVLLYEALAGCLPFEGSALGILLEKSARPPISPRVHNPAVTRELEHLCMRLLERDVALRAGANDVLRFTGAEPVSGLLPNLTSATNPVLPLVGREQELGALRAEWQRVCAEDLRVVLIEGASGIGKTALMDEAVQQLVAQQPDMLVLRGRCHAAEQVRYKLWDGVVDALCKYLFSLSQAECARLIPGRADYLPLLFPVFARVKAVPKPPLGRLRDVASQRFAMFEQFGELLERVARRCPVVVCVDDLQWGDADSLAMLQVMLSLDRKPRLLLLTTVRPLEELEPHLASKLDEMMTSSPCFSRLPLEALDESESVQLSAGLLGLAHDHPSVQQIAHEARGNPWCAMQMAHSFTELDGQALPPTDLEGALCRRVERLGPYAKRVMDLLSVAGGPQPSAVLRHALGIEGAVLEQALSALRAHKLVRPAMRGTWMCYHDRVREALESGLSGTVRKTAHAQLAQAWRREGGSPERIAAHFRAADEPDLALPWLERAAEAAEETGAYGQAAELYREVLSVREGRNDEASTLLPLRIRLADALASAGHGAASARVLLSLLETSSPDDRTDLQVRAAEQLIRAGEVREGVEAARIAFEALGMTWPKSQANALMRLLWQRLTLHLRGHKVKLRAGPLPALEQARLDALFRLSRPLSWADLLRAAELSLRYLRGALDSGDPHHVARALIEEGTMAAMQDPDGRNATGLLAQADALLERGASPSLLSLKEFALGSGFVSSGDAVRAVAKLESALTICETQCPSETWQLSNIRSVYMPARIMLGQHRAFLTDAERWISEAQLRGDTFAFTAYVVTGAGYTRHLMVDAPARAIDEIDAAMAVWQGEHFGLQHCFALTAKQVVLGYEGGVKGFETLDREWPRARGSILWRMGLTREILLVSCGYAALSACVADRENAHFRHVLNATCRDLVKAHSYYGRSSGALLRAQHAWLSQDLNKALALAQTALQNCLKAGLYSHRHAALLVALCSQAKDTAGKASALAEWLYGEGWTNPERAIQMLLPIYPLIKMPS